MKWVYGINLILLITSCVGWESNQGGSKYRLRLEDSSAKVLTQADVMNVIDWIALDTSEMAILGDISKIETYENTYYVLDKVIRKSIFVFDEQGKFLRRIGRIGQGPGEYIHIYDFAIDRKKGHIAILTDASTVYLYDLQGNFITSKQVDKSLLWNITSMDHGYLLSSNHQTYVEGENAYLLYAFDSDLNTIGKWVHVLPFQMPTMPLMSSSLQSVDGNAYYCDVFVNGIYQYDNKADSVMKVYDVQFTYPLPDEIKVDLMTFMSKQRDYDYLYEMAVAEKGKIMLHYICRGEFNFAVVSDGVILQQGHYQGRFPKVFHGSDGEFVSPISVEEYIEYWKEQEMKLYTDSVGIEDNFLLLRWKLK